MDFTDKNGVPNPGSDAALDAGCTCPVLDNGHGRRSDGLFWITLGCPLHGFEKDDAE